MQPFGSSSRSGQRMQTWIRGGWPETSSWQFAKSDGSDGAQAHRAGRRDASLLGASASKLAICIRSIVTKPGCLPTTGWGRGVSAALLADRTPPQREAVEHAGGPLLILAGAG